MKTARILLIALMIALSSNMVAGCRWWQPPAPPTPPGLPPLPPPPPIPIPDPGFPDRH